MATMPSNPVPQKTKIKSLVQNTVSVAQSLRSVVSSRGGQRWGFTLEYPATTRDDIAALLTFLNAREGRFDAFYFNFPNQPTRGTMAGSPVVFGGGQLGRTLATAGWPANSNGVLRVGDFIRVEGDYKTYQVTEDVNSGDDGRADIPIFPTIQKSPIDGNALRSDNRFRVALTSDDLEVDIGQALHYGLSIELLEVLR
ncbi:hypothetical protein [Pontiella sp.]|uniref:hypothetical protein n=1 Tax=Pontiella sp. TaxID=2837462 RepID=UPI003567520D